MQYVTPLLDPRVASSPLPYPNWTKRERQFSPLGTTLYHDVGCAGLLGRQIVQSS